MSLDNTSHPGRPGCRGSGIAMSKMWYVVQETLLAIHLKRQIWDENEALSPTKINSESKPSSWWRGSGPCRENNVARLA